MVNLRTLAHQSILWVGPWFLGRRHQLWLGNALYGVVTFVAYPPRHVE